MLTRLSDLTGVDKKGKPCKIHRYGLWGTTSEIHSRGRKWIVVHPNGKEQEFKFKEEAKVYLEDIVSGRIK